MVPYSILGSWRTPRHSPMVTSKFNSNQIFSYIWKVLLLYLQILRCGFLPAPALTLTVLYSLDQWSAVIVVSPLPKLSVTLGILSSLLLHLCLFHCNWMYQLVIYLVGEYLAQNTAFSCYCQQFNATSWVVF